jgi:hypothetical protein
MLLRESTTRKGITSDSSDSTTSRIGSKALDDDRTADTRNTEPALPTPNPLTLFFPLFVGAFGWQVHGWIAGILLAVAYLILLLIANNVVIWTPWILSDEASLETQIRVFQRIKWCLFIAFMVGIS